MIQWSQSHAIPTKGSPTAYPNLIILWQMGKILLRSPAPKRLLTKDPLVAPKELTITKKSVETLRVILETASSIFPKCSIATKNKNHGTMLIKE